MTSRSAVRGLVLARGLGTRMRAAGDAASRLTAEQASAADAGLKAMMPFGGAPSERSESKGRPFLDHVLHRLAEAGIRQAGLVIGPEHTQVRQYYGSLQTSRLVISFVTQQEPLGTADAVAAAEEWIGDDPFLVLNADNLYPADVLARLVEATGPAAPGFDAASLELPIDRLGTFALMERDDRGCLKRIVEKPGEQAVRTAGAHALISMNVWRLDRRIFEFCRSVPLSRRGERELPQAVGLAASAGICFELFDASGPVVDLSRRGDVAAVARVLEGARVEL